MGGDGLAPDDGNERGRVVAGVRLHRAVASVLALGPNPSDSQIDSVIGDLLVHDEATWRLRASWIELATGLRTYLARYQPAPPWRFFATEFRLDDAVADLVFTDGGEEAGPNCRDARFMVDELKRVTSRRSLVTRRNLEQYHRLLSGGKRRWGARFAGLRIVAPALGICVILTDPNDILGLIAFSGEAA